MRRSGVVAVAVVIVLVLAVPGVAAAHRVASSGERAAMLYEAGNHYSKRVPVDEPRSFPARCAFADIATVVPGSQWGAYTFNSHAGGCQRFGFNAVVIEHKLGCRWFVLWEGSDGYPSNVPRPIFKDLTAGLSVAL